MARKSVIIVLSVLFGVPLGLVVAMFLIGANAERTADVTDITPSLNLRTIAQAYQLGLPSIPSVDCDDPRYVRRGVVSKYAASLSFNSLVDEARSAESASIRYQATGDHKMAAVAASDAVKRWSRVLDLKAAMNCYDLQSRRGSY